MHQERQQKTAMKNNTTPFFVPRRPLKTMPRHKATFQRPATSHPPFSTGVTVLLCFFAMVREGAPIAPQKHGLLSLHEWDSLCALLCSGGKQNRGYPLAKFHRSPSSPVSILFLDPSKGHEVMPMLICNCIEDENPSTSRLEDARRKLLSSFDLQLPQLPELLPGPPSKSLEDLAKALNNGGVTVRIDFGQNGGAYDVTIPPLAPSQTSEKSPGGVKLKDLGLG
jgi:hypothetical protein